MLNHLIRVKQSAELLHRKLANLIAGGVLKYVKIVKGMQLVQLTMLANETATNLQHPQEYGFTSKAKAGASALALFKGGNRDNGLVVTIYDRRYLPANLSDGDSCQYDAAGNRIWLKGSAGISITDALGNSIVMSAAGIAITANNTTPVTFNSPVIFNEGFTLNGGAGVGSGSIAVSGNVSDANGSMQEMRDTYNGHTHDAPGGTTDHPNQPMS